LPTLTIDAIYDYEVQKWNTNYAKAQKTVPNVGRNADKRDCRISITFPLADLPSINLDVTQVQFKLNVTTAGASDHLADIHPYNGDGQADPRADAADICWARCGGGTQYLNDLTDFRTTGLKTFTLGAQACTDIENAKAAVNRFSLGLHEEGDDSGSAVIDGAAKSGAILQLLITFSAFIPKQGHFKWYRESWQAEDAILTNIENGQALQFRACIQETGGLAGSNLDVNVDYREDAEAYENFLNYIESDPNGRLSQTEGRSSFTGLRRGDTNTYLYKDFGAGYFAENFEIQFEFKITANAGAERLCIRLFSLANSPSGEGGIEIKLANSGIGNFHVYFNGNWSYGAPAFALNTQYYATLKRVGSNIELKIRTGSHTGPIVFLFSLTNSTAYQFIVTSSSLGLTTYPDDYMTGYVENLRVKNWHSLGAQTATDKVFRWRDDPTLVEHQAIDQARLSCTTSNGLIHENACANGENIGGNAHREINIVLQPYNVQTDKTYRFRVIIEGVSLELNAEATDYVKCTTAAPPPAVGYQYNNGLVCIQVAG